MRGRVFALLGTVNGCVTIVASIVAGGVSEAVGTRAVVIASGSLHVLPLAVAVTIAGNTGPGPAETGLGRQPAS